jgi:iron-sulfur cluster repair protein YtfE (RIC family)
LRNQGLHGSDSKEVDVQSISQEINEVTESPSADDSGVADFDQGKSMGSDSIDYIILEYHYQKA